ncbi:chloride channel protein [Streptomonospora wellingtoniae]|uniref:Chloride channel protein n=1 Tax=Streptomonospora wellingtoniae TaxID=3075544 RepID=A0ABU2KQI1_9ACTN|nr:chloride channel protein [Streptomonospora sp. DSM 45055]MDT0301535.1 chloride channel protein [Streptomonospora sp. DSM 45055]
MTESLDPAAMLRSRRYVGLLLIAGALGVPVSAAAFGFLALTEKLQTWVFADLPKVLGFAGAPVWWPVPVLVVAGALVGAAIRYLPGAGGEPPTEGFKAQGAPVLRELPGVALAALATLSAGAVLGPEAPLITLGGGLAVLAVRLAKRDAPPQLLSVVAASGSFAAVSTLLGSPILGAFLLMEAAGLGGSVLSLVLVPGLLGAGTGSLIFIGLDSWTGLGTFSLRLPDVPDYSRPDVAEFAWAIAIGVAAALLGTAIRRLAKAIQPFAQRHLLLVTPLLGLIIALLAMTYTAGTGKPSSQVLFSGETAVGPLIAHSAEYSVASLLLLIACKGLAYTASLSGFRGGPTFPAMFLGAAGGVLLSHLVGLSLVAGVAMGIGAMSVVMLRLPLTSVMLATLLLFSDGLAVMPLVIVAVTVAYVVSAQLTPVVAAEPAPAPGQGPAPHRR